MSNPAPIPGWLSQRLRCPECRAAGLRLDATAVTCMQCGSSFPMSRGRPILLRHDNTLFPRSAYVEARSARAGRSLLTRLAPGRSVNMTYRRNLETFVAALVGTGGTSVLVIGAGAQKRWLDGFFARHPAIQVAYSDIDVGATVDLFCDAHELPFHDGALDGVVASAVLEHVLYPERAAAEIHRVLAPGGLVYSEIPFLQQVHEGAYDFTRYTLSGHRRLFNRFEETASSVVAGPGTTLAWSLEHFAVCCAPHRVFRTPLRMVVRVAFFWLKYFDYVFGQSAAAMDGASCTSFLGRKGAATPDEEIVKRYVGLKRTRHV